MKTPSAYYRAALAVAGGAVLFLIWGVGALGIIGAGGRPDLMYAAVLAVGLIGAVATRLRAAGMAWVLLAMAATQVCIGLIALLAGLQETEGASVIEILGLTGMYAGLFGFAAWLFRRAAEEATPARAEARA